MSLPLQKIGKLDRMETASIDELRHTFPANLRVAYVEGDAGSDAVYSVLLGVTADGEDKDADEDAEDSTAGADDGGDDASSTTTTGGGGGGGGGKDAAIDTFLRDGWMTSVTASKLSV